MITFEEFNEKFYDLSMNERLRIYNKYCDEESSDERIEENCNDRLSEYYEGDIEEALRAAQHGDYDVTDKYFRVNSYGNLNSFGDIGAMEIIECELDSIYEYPEFWREYIDPEDDDED